MKMTPRYLTIFFLCWVATGVALAEAPKVDAYMQAPALDLPKTSGVAGEYARYAVGEGSLARGSFQVNLAISFDQKAGALGQSFLPTYTPEGAMTEWGMSWSAGLEIKRVNLFKEVDYQSDHLATPFGRLVPGDDGYWYPASADSRLKAKVDGHTITVFDDKGARYTFGGDNVVLGPKAEQVFAWYLSKVVAKNGDETIFSYKANASGRLFLDDVLYGGRQGAFVYKLSLRYETIAAERRVTSYESGSAKTIDRRVSALDFFSGIQAFAQPRYSYKFGYKESNLGPTFYLTSTQKVFASGQKEPATSYQYDDVEQFLTNANNDFVAKLEPVMQALGTQIISPKNVSLLDYNDDGLSDFEVPKANKLFVQQANGFDEIDVSPAADADQGCVNDPTGAKPPRNISRVTGNDDTYHVLAVFPAQNASQTRLKVCNLKSQLEFDQTYGGSFYSLTRSRFADLNRDGKPDFLTVEGNTLRILENTSQGGAVSFAEAPAQTIADASSLEVIWIADINGDGVVDVVGKNNLGVYAYFGMGGLRFSENPIILKLQANTGEQINPNKYALSLVDINNDGLLDLILTQGQKILLFMNEGNRFVTSEMPALGGRDDMYGYPIMARFTDRGPIQLITPDGRGKALNIALSRASLGMLVGFSDGKGNRISFKYEYTKPEPTMRWQRPLMVSKEVRTTGKGVLAQQYTYAGPLQHSHMRSFIAFSKVSSKSKPVDVDSDFTANDNFEVLQTRRESRDAIGGLIATQTMAYASKLLHGIPVSLLNHTESALTDRNGQNATVMRQDFGDFNDFGCAGKQLSSTNLGRTSIVRTYLTSDAVGGSPECLVVEEKTTGTHQANAALDFSYEKKLSYDASGFVISSDFGAEGATKRQAEFTYDDLHRLIKMRTVDGGATSFSYKADTRVLLSVVDPHGVERVATIDDETFLTRALAVNRGNGIQDINYVAFDGLERAEKIWSGLAGSEQSAVQSFRYAYATQNTAGRVFTANMISPESIAKTTAVYAGDGELLAKLIKESDAWKIKSLMKYDMADSTAKSMRRGPYDDADIQGDIDALYADAQVSSTTLVDTNGRSIKSVARITADATKKETLAFDISSNALQTSISVNGEFKKVLTEVPGFGVVKYTDEKGHSTTYERDALGRLRRVVFPGGKIASCTYDALARESVIAFEGVGSIRKSYDGASKRPLRREYFDRSGALSSSVEFAYDASMRLTKKTFKAGSEENSFAYKYDGEGLSSPLAAAGQKGFLSVVEGAGFRHEMIYRSDGKMSFESLSVSSDMRASKAYEYGADGSLLSQTVKVMPSNGAERSYKKSFLFGEDGLLSGMSVNGSKLFSIANDNAAEPSALTFADGSKWEIEVDDVSRVAEKFSGSFPNLNFQLGMKYDNRATVSQENVKINDVAKHRGYTYDERGFISSESSGLSQLSFDYNDDGFLSTLRNKSVTREDALVKVDSSEHKLDKWGRLTESNGFTYTYGANNQISSSSKGAKTFDLRYDQDGERIAIAEGGHTVALFFEGLIYRDGSIYETVKVGNQFIGILKNGTFIPVATTSNGTLLADKDSVQWGVDAYGERDAVLADTLSVLDFAGHRRDPELGLIHMGARDYSPSTANFASPDFFFYDNFEEVASRPVEANLFSYAANDPVNKIDPSGRNAFILLDMKGAGGNGHIGIIIGNQAAGYNFFSMAMPVTRGEDAGGQLFDALFARRTAVVQQTYKSDLNDMRLHDNDYDTFFEISTTAEQDQAMTAYALEQKGNPPSYGVLTNNCAHFVRDVLSRGGIADPSDWNTARPSVVFSDYLKSYPDRAGNTAGLDDLVRFPTDIFKAADKVDGMIRIPST